MLRISVGILEDKRRVFQVQPYTDIPGAHIIYFPAIEDSQLTELLRASPERTQEILRYTSNPL